MPHRSNLPAAALLAALAAAPVSAQTPRNIIVFVADGCGENTHRAYELWRGEPALYRSPGWSRHSVATYGLRSGPRPERDLPPLQQDPRLVYDPAKAWDIAPVEGAASGYPFLFAGYQWLRATAADSANTATAIFTGVTTYKGAINVDGAGNPVRAVAEAASAQGLAIGLVSSVPISHATMASAGGAHVPSREMFPEITHQMLTSGVCDVIAGAGHPQYDDNAQKRTETACVYIGHEDWVALRAGTLAPQGERPWTLVEDAAQIASLSAGDVPLPLLIMPKVGLTLQQQRAPREEGKTASPGDHKLNEGLPTLQDMALAALNAVDDDPYGFFLMIEGGAVDWAMHDNQLGRMIEEMADFHGTIGAICAQLDAGDRTYDWSNTLVIVTADHDHLLWGPDSDTIAFQPLRDNGPGKLPGYKWHSGSHSNQPVPLFVRGPGSERFAAIPTQPDNHATPDGRNLERPPYFHQAEIGKLLHRLIAERGDAVGLTPPAPH
jgi:alkaline phosphatase